MYVKEINDYVSEILTDNNPHTVSVKTDCSHVHFEVSGVTRDDKIYFKIDRNIKKKCYLSFRNGCPAGKFEMTDELKRKFIKFMRKRSFFKDKIIKR